MKASKRELQYAKLKFNEVHHTTLNPEGPGVVRIHLVPPAIKGKEIPASAAIINGQDIVPVNVSWSILLTELIEQINEYSGRPINQKDADDIVEKTCASVRRVYRFTSKKRLRNDIYRIMNSLSRIARGQIPDEAIGYTELRDYAQYMKAPHRMDLMVSAMTKDGAWHCNQRCVHCYAAGQVRSDEEELPTEAWKRIIDKCRAIGVPQVTFTGGEPTMRDDIFELIHYARWFITRLNTNGLKLTEQYCENLKKSALDSVQITFYSSDREVHNRLVGVDGYDKTLDGIKNALACGLSLSINTPLCTLNADYVKTLEFLHGLGVIYVTCSGLITTGNARTNESESLQLDRASMSAILTDAVKYCHENGMEISFTSPGWVDDGLCRDLGISTPGCGACLSNMAITPGGGVVPCQSWLSDEPLGDFLNDEWESIWNSERCAERRGFSATARFECPLRVMKGRGERSEK